MPEGIAVDVEDGVATIDFIDAAKRGPGVQALIDAGGPGAVEVDTRTGPRKLYIVSEKVASDAGLLDEATEAIPAFDRSSGTDISGIVNPETPTSEYTVGQTQRAGEYRGELREGLGTGVSDSVGQAAHTDLNNALTGVVQPITSVPNDPSGQRNDAGTVEAVTAVDGPKGNQVTGGAELPVGTPPDQPTAHDSQVKLPAGEAFPLGSDHPVTAQGTPEVGAEQPGIVQLTADGDVAVALDQAISLDEQLPTDATPTAAEVPGTEPAPAVEATSAPEAPAEDESYPEGSPNLRWTRKQLNAYAKHEKGIDTTDEDVYQNKDLVLAAINAPK